MGLPLYETPTGWKYFGSLLDAGRITLCGEESAGTGSDHVREKDGLWAVLLWLNILAVRGQPVQAILTDHWRRFGRDYYERHDYEALDTSAAEAVMAGLRSAAPKLAGRVIHGLTVDQADDFAYEDPVDGSSTTKQGVRIQFREDARIVYRLSGTGTQGATLRIYLERYEPDSGRQHLQPGEVLAELAVVAQTLADLPAKTGRLQPSVVA
jgi:phosphoglucomutase